MQSASVAQWPSPLGIKWKQEFRKEFTVLALLKVPTFSPNTCFKTQSSEKLQN